jgi:hypothetical protein
MPANALHDRRSVVSKRSYLQRAQSKLLRQCSGSFHALTCHRGEVAVNVPLAVLGIVFLAAAAVGGGLKAMNIEVGILESGRRQILLALIGAVALGLAFLPLILKSNTQSSSQAQVNPTVASGPSQRSSQTQSASTKSPAPTPVWTSTGKILIGPQSGIDFDSIPPGPGSGSNTLILYGGSELYTSGSIKIATWTKDVPPTRDQCNALAQAQGNFEQPAEVGGQYCLLTGQGQGHTVYLKIASIDTSNTADVTAYADVIVWNTSG